jgi:hypothetical protein
MSLSNVESNDVTGESQQERPVNVETKDDDGGEPIVYRVLTPERLGSYAVRPRPTATNDRKNARYTD